MLCVSVLVCQSVRVLECQRHHTTTTAPQHCGVTDCCVLCHNSNTNTPAAAGEERALHHSSLSTVHRSNVYRVEGLDKGSGQQQKLVFFQLISDLISQGQYTNYVAGRQSHQPLVIDWQCHTDSHGIMIMNMNVTTSSLNFQ